MRNIRACDEGTDYADALIAGDRAGAVDSTDAQIMAAFCEDVMQILVGAFSPRLVWEGAQKAGLTTLALAKLCNDKNLQAIDDLQWSE
jgi:hypothetical protein